MLHSGKNKRLKKGFSTVWLTVIWVVWKMRNERVFNNGNGAVADAMDLIQRLSWQWFLNNSAKRSCLLYEWIWDPGDCMLRWEVFFWCRRRCCGCVFCQLLVSLAAVFRAWVCCCCFFLFFHGSGCCIFLQCFCFLSLWLVVLPSLLFCMVCFLWTYSTSCAICVP
jgi:hypothetical protein